MSTLPKKQQPQTSSGSTAAHSAGTAWGGVPDEPLGTTRHNTAALSHPPAHVIDVYEAGAAVRHCQLGLGIPPLHSSTAQHSKAHIRHEEGHPNM